MHALSLLLHTHANTHYIIVYDFIVALVAGRFVTLGARARDFCFVLAFERDLITNAMMIVQTMCACLRAHLSAQSRGVALTFMIICAKCIVCVRNPLADVCMLLYARAAQYNAEMHIHTHSHSPSMVNDNKSELSVR